VITVVGGLVLAIGALASPARAGAAGVAADTIVMIRTSAGPIGVELDVENAPRTATNFLRYVHYGFYEGGAFYRVVRQDNQPQNDIRIDVIQGGIDPERRELAFDPIAMEGTGETGVRHLDGTISMARDGPDTARGEFFITIGDQPELDEGGRRNPDGRGFAAFGRVIMGMDVVRRIQGGRVDAQTLLEPVVIYGVDIVGVGGDLAGQRSAVSASRGFDAESLVAEWIAMWGTYDLDRVRELFLPDARVNYLSSEREGLIVGIDSLMPHHEGFGFVPGGVESSAELWVEDIDGVSFGKTAVVTGVWFFGERAARADAQRGPMTVVYTLYGDEYRIAHMHFANYEP
jgi:peptidyl-prolyl cis-trans isomerase A (cyclophilin A)